MIFRCRTCHGTVWLEEDRQADEPGQCRGCGQPYDLALVPRTPKLKERLSEDARRLAQEQAIDLPGAYSVLLGVMTAEEVRELGQAGSIACSTHATEPGESQSSVGYDRAFDAAVRAGQLTPRQAAERGKRHAYASQLAERHKLTLELACDVADNRVSLLEALRQRAARPQAPLRVGVRAGPRAILHVYQRWMLAAALLVVVITLALKAKPAPSRPADARPDLAGPSGILTDAGGRLTQVDGPDPGSVLRTYCASAVPGRPFEAIDVVPSAQIGPRARLGLMRDPSAPAQILAITVREDTARGRWVAGDGQDPLLPTPAPSGVELGVRRTRHPPGQQHRPDSDAAEKPVRH